MGNARENVRLTADVILLATIDGQQHVLLIQRRRDPYQGRWALPGGHVDTGEATEAAAHRELTEETGITVGSLTLAGVYAEPGRDPRGRYVTFAYRAFIPGVMSIPKAADDAEDARWWPVEELTEQMMAFDHYTIILDAIGYALPAR
jgi:8-oxo-dGTP diphosphatase